MADNFGVEVEVEEEDSSTTSDVVWSLQTSRHDSDMTKVESVLCVREKTMKNEIAQLKNERKDLDSLSWGVQTAFNDQISGDTS
ncbi:hypothetical protein LWI28_019384 [Acer negundo]|uniref:Uncharacterized protein n=1 Tax=Acer negundo TaxID=4023 RepID=A0AAD5JMK1_ACENE|nr:hypothetical protein LWI28_019384 [Acer negundo]